MDPDMIGISTMHTSQSASSDIVATAVDGTEFHITPSQWVEVPVDRVKRLKARPLYPPEVAYIRDLLQNSTMLELTTLVVDHDDPAASSGAAASPPPVFSLFSRRFPSLSSIKLSHAAMALTPALASQLRVLEMDSGVSGVPLQLPLAPFLDCLGSLSRIENLFLTYCFAPPADVGVFLNPAARRPLNASQLQALKIKDYPFNIGKIMSELIVPTSANVHLHGDARGASLQHCGSSAFLAMLPHDRDRLPMLHSCKHIEISVDHCEYQLEASMRDGDDYRRPSLKLELDNDFLLTPNPAASTARMTLLRSLLSGLKHIFQDTRAVTYLKLLGPVSAVNVDEWADSLARLPNLRHLIADDEFLNAFPTNLLSALRGPRQPSSSAPPLLCPDLHSLELYGDINVARENTEQLKKIMACLDSRSRHGGPAVLHQLKLELFSTVALPGQLLEQYRRGFYRFALESSLTVKLSPKHGRRAWLAGSAASIVLPPRTQGFKEVVRQM